MSNISRSIRLSQVIGNFGVGAIYDFLGESLILTDIKYWLESRYNGKGQEITATRLIESLRVSGFPRVGRLFQPTKYTAFGGQSGSLPYMRFPRWLFCSSCRRMKRWNYVDEIKGESPKCTCERKTRLSPMRFVMICQNGHLADVDWKRWAHSKPDKQNQITCQSDKLLFESGHTKSGGLESVAVKCSDCEAFRSLEGITAPNILMAIGISCSSKQPWQQSLVEPCSENIHVVQRGAGNVYFPSIASAITIPPESGFMAPEKGGKSILIKDHGLYGYLKSTDRIGHRQTFETLLNMLCNAVNCTTEEVMSCLDGAENEEPGTVHVDIELEEWQALITINLEYDDRDKFVTRHIDIDTQNYAEALGNSISKLVSVIKLREVRVLTGFHRYHPGGEENSKEGFIQADLGAGLDWLPATESFGEGIFITLNESQVSKWEENELIIKRAKLLNERTEKSSLGFLEEIDARFILLHTLAHLLIRRLAFECGYSSASLRERIYSKKGARAGILIYTSSGDSEGTLGGLSRQAEDDRFVPMFLNALRDAVNCSADPICMESTGQGVEGLNLAACHACALVSETSCTHFNVSLDRVLVIGEQHIKGFFQNVLTSAMESSVKLIQQ
jgi:hypothetical protein